MGSNINEDRQLENYDSIRVETGTEDLDDYFEKIEKSFQNIGGETSDKTT